MIERQIISQKIKEYQIQEYIANSLKRVGHSHTKLQRTPLGEKIIIFASRPGLIVGRKGQNIKNLTKTLKSKFKLENPQIEISEVENINLNASIVAERIVNSLERFGSGRFKGVGHKSMEEIMSSGALGVEILISGKIPSSRAKRWRFYQGYLKKSGDISVMGVDKAYSTAHLKTGAVGIQVRIMPPDVKLPDDVKLFDEKEEIIEEIKEKVKEEEKEEVKTEKKKEDVKVEKKVEGEKPEVKEKKEKKPKKEEKKTEDKKPEPEEKTEKKG